MNYRLLAFAFCAFTMLVPRPALAEPREYCVICSGPGQTYRCQVDTPNNSTGDKGLQLFCIISLSKDGGHNSCAIQDNASAACAGPLRTYAFTAPAITPQLRSAAEKIRKSRNKATDNQQARKEPEAGAPKTLIDMTGRAIKASRKGLKNTRQAVGGAASSTTQKVGKAARGAGKGVTKTARKVGSATKKTGGTVGSAAKRALDCLKSWFKECGSEPAKALPATQ